MPLLKKPKDLKQKSLSSLRKKAWKVFSEYIRRRDKGICYTCGVKQHWKQTHAGHFIHRNALDFDERAIHCQCVRCNYFLSGALVAYTIRMVKQYGEEVIEELQRLSRMTKKFSRAELEDIIRRYKWKETKQNKV